MDIDNWNIVEIAEQFLKGKSDGSKTLCGQYFKLQTTVLAAKEQRVSSPKEFLELWRGDGFTENDIAVVRSLFRYANRSPYNLGYSLTANDLRHRKPIRQARDYNVPIEQIREDLKEWGGPIGCAGRFASLGIGPAELIEVDRLEGNRLIYSDGRVLELDKEEVDMLHDFDMFYPGGPWATVKEDLSYSKDPTIASNKLLWRWSAERAKGEMPYTLKQIASCFAVSALKRGGIGSVNEVAKRLGIRPISLRQNLPTWLKKGYLSIDNFDAILS